MKSMNVSLPDPMKDWVQAQIDGGQYASNSDYVRDLIRRDQARSAALDDLRAAIQAGLADIEAGHVEDGQTVIDALRGRIADARL